MSTHQAYQAFNPPASELKTGDRLWISYTCGTGGGTTRLVTVTHLSTKGLGTVDSDGFNIQYPWSELSGWCYADDIQPSKEDEKPPRKACQLKLTIDGHTWDDVRDGLWNFLSNPRNKTFCAWMNGVSAGGPVSMIYEAEEDLTMTKERYEAELEAWMQADEEEKDD